MNGKPNIILTCSYSINTRYESYINYMTRKEATGGVIDEGSRTVAGGVQQDPTITKQNPVSQSVGEKSFTELNTRDYGKYIGYMVRVQALASKDNLSESESKELQKVKRAAKKMDPSTSVKKDKTLSGYWTVEQETVQLQDLGKIRNKMRLAEKNGSVLWQDVVSFDNDFLIDEGIYDPKTNYLDEAKLHEASKNMMTTLEKNEKLYNPFWTVAIHRNTDNIHLHFSIVEEKNSRPLVKYKDTLQPRGNFKKSTISKMKSSFSNTLLDRSAIEREITQERQNIRQNISSALKKNQKDKVLNHQLKELIDSLPSDKRKWKYGTLQKMDSTLIEKIDSITHTMLTNDENYKKWRSLVNTMDKKSKEQYGRTSESYTSNQEQDLKKRVGNRLLADLAKADSIKKENLKKFTVTKSLEKPKKRIIVSDLDSIKESLANANKKLNEHFFRTNVSGLGHDYRESTGASGDNDVHSSDATDSKFERDYRKSTGASGNSDVHSSSTTDSKFERDYRESTGASGNSDVHSSSTTDSKFEHAYKKSGSAFQKKKHRKKPFLLKKPIVNQRLTKKLQKNVNKDYQSGLTSLNKVKALDSFREATESQINRSDF
ncbi:MAG: relaxase MobL [Lactobacillus sp.]|nr:relaxase MobL [Lactobacillus sp.]